MLRASPALAQSYVSQFMQGKARVLYEERRRAQRQQRGEAECHPCRQTSGEWIAADFKELAQSKGRCDLRRGLVCFISAEHRNLVNCIFVFIGERRSPWEGVRCRFSGRIPRRL
jgi:hypothetical protein